LFDLRFELFDLTINAPKSQIGLKIASIPNLYHQQADFNSKEFLRNQQWMTHVLAVGWCNGRATP